MGDADVTGNTVSVVATVDKKNGHDIGYTTAIVPTDAGVGKKIGDAINALDSSVSVKTEGDYLTGEDYLTSVTQTDGKLTGYTAKALPTVGDSIIVGKFVTSVSEIRGVISVTRDYVSYSDLTDKPTVSGTATFATLDEENQIVTLKTGAKLSDESNVHTLSNNSGTDIQLAKIAKTGSIYDIVDTGAIIFDCGTAFEVI
jgi:hypothetical protein